MARLDDVAFGNSAVFVEIREHHLECTYPFKSTEGRGRPRGAGPVQQTNSISKY